MSQKILDRSGQIAVILWYLFFVPASYFPKVVEKQCGLV